MPSPTHVYTMDELHEHLEAVKWELTFCRTAADTLEFSDVGEAIGQCGDPIDEALALLAMKEPSHE
jgi:hypothetical protein